MTGISCFNEVELRIFLSEETSRVPWATAVDAIIRSGMSGTSFRGTLAIARATSIVMSKHHSAIIGSATIASILAFAPQ